MPPVTGRCGGAGGGASGVPAGAAVPTVFGVWGDCRDSWGVVGTSRLDMGLAGFSREYIGVFGESDDFVGVTGQSNGAAGMGVWGSGGSVGVLGSAGRPGSYAGLFYGDVHIKGKLTVDTLPKASVVAHPDGSQRILCAVESPESWFEDFGRAEVTEGQARVALDDEFAALVRTDDYHVFLTPEGPSNGLYVSGRADREFEVREQGDGRSSLPFSYRVVARPQAAESARLREFEAPPEPPALRPRTKNEGQ